MKIFKNPALWFTLYLALLGGSYVPYHMALPVRVTYHAIMTALLIWWIWRDGLPSTPLLWPLAATGAIAFISAVNAIDPRIALENWWHYLINGLLLLMLISWMRRDLGETVFKAHFLAGGAIIAICALEWLAAPGERVGGAFLLINLTGAYAAALLIPAVAWFLSERRAWYLLIALGLAGVLVLNDSRGAFISAGVAGVVFLLLRYRVQLPVILVGMAITIALAFGVMNRSQESNHASGDILRADLWRSAIAMLKDHPLTGVGPGLFGQAFRTYRTISADNATGAHDVYLNMLAELGLPGAVVSGLTGVVFLRSIARKRTMKQDAILAALAGIAVHLLFDNFPATNFVFLVNLYVAYLVAQTGHQRERSQQRVGLEAVATGLLLIFGVVLGCFDLAQMHYENSLRTGSLLEARTAATIDPMNRIYSIQVARLEGNEAQIARLDPTLSSTTDLGVYGIINFGRVFS